MLDDIFKLVFNRDDIIKYLEDRASLAGAWDCPAEVLDRRIAKLNSVISLLSDYALLFLIDNPYMFERIILDQIFEA